MIAVLAIARSTITELRRQRLLLIPIIGVVLSLLALVGALLVGGSVDLADREAEQAAWAVGSGAGVGGAIYALIVGASLIARELSDGTMLMLAARPVGRWQIVFGRLLGAAAFIVATLVATCVVYGLVASVVSGTFAPVDEPLRALWYTVPGVLLALCVGTAFSVQGRATAAIGSAVIVSAFATGLAGYVDSWRTEGHLRSYMTQEARDTLRSNDPVVGPVSRAMVTVMPYGVLVGHAAQVGDERMNDDAPRVTGPTGTAYDPDRITVGPSGNGGFATVGPVESGPGMPSPDTGPIKGPSAADLRTFAGQCADTGGGASCWFAVRDAWKRGSFPARPDLYDGWELLLAWLAIPFWMGVSILLLTRRRDLA